MSTYRLYGLSAAAVDWFRDYRQQAQKRMGRTELQNDEFLAMVLDVYAFHLDREGRQSDSQPADHTPVCPVCECTWTEGDKQEGVTDGGHPSDDENHLADGGSDGTERCWDSEDCPRDACEGELQQQDQFNVMCLSCEGVWTHWKDEREHVLVTADHEAVARKPRAVTDGGRQVALDGENLADTAIDGPVRSDPPTKDSVKAAFGVVGMPRNVLIEEHDTLSEIEDASRVELVNLDGVGHATVDKIEDAEKLYEEGDEGYLVTDGGRCADGTTQYPAALSERDDMSTAVTGVNSVCPQLLTLRFRSA